MFSEIYALKYLKILDLSHNNIENIDILFNCKLWYLDKLNLSYNRISNINCLSSNDINLQSIFYLDLSNNNIENLVNMKLPHLKNINLLSNRLISGINLFFQNHKPNSLSIKKINDKELFFESSGNLIIYLSFYLKDINIINFLLQFNFTNIKNLDMKNFTNDELFFF